MAETKTQRDWLDEAAHRLYEHLDGQEIIGRVAAHRLFPDQIETILRLWLQSFLFENWTKVQEIKW